MKNQNARSFLDDALSSLSVPEWNIGFKYFFYDSKKDVNIDIFLLMQHFGFTEEHELFTSYFEKYPNSVAMPMSNGVDNFFQHLKDVGIFKNTDEWGALEQTPQTEGIYNKILAQTEGK